MVGPGMSHMKGTECFRLAVGFGIIFGIKIHLVPPKFNINEFRFFSLPSCHSAAVHIFVFFICLILQACGLMALRELSQNGPHGA